MLRYPDYTRERLLILSRTLRDLVYADTVAVSELLVTRDSTGRIPYAQAASLPLSAFRPAALGEAFGPLWATYWFRVRARVPAEWAGSRVDFLWASHSEATLWQAGRSLQGLNYDPHSFDMAVRPDAVLLRSAAGGEELQLEVEMACNQTFGYESHRVAPYKTVSPYVLERADLGRFDPEAWDLYHDFATLQALEAEVVRTASPVTAGPDIDRAWAGLLLSELNRFANLFDASDRSTWAPARAILTPLLARRNGTTVHELSAIGHAHIDTAWLWPVAETRRKCIRTFSTQCSYMDEYPTYRFSCSQAQQYEYVQQDNPDLFERIRERQKRGQWVIVGGTWIEPDCNIPSGESLMRQFLFGQRYFQREFGVLCREFWNPDVFGYNGQLPQICNLMGIRRFLTQKLSWNRFNKPAHHTFVWEGIDGSEVFTHFPPADTYNAVATVAQIRDNARQYKDHDRSRHSLMLFGYGDGGGGPTREMIERILRGADLEGLPRTQMRTSDEFFELLEADCTDRVRMIGELYFEYHRGTYTTQAATKLGNRRGEVLLHDVELVAEWVRRSGEVGYTYPTAQLEHLWKLLLLNQFHDILPGSSIQEAYEDAARDYAEIQKTGTELLNQALTALAGSVTQCDGAPRAVAFNAAPFTRREVVELPGEPLKLAVMEAEPTAPAVLSVDHGLQPVVATSQGSTFVLENEHLRALLAADGTLLSLVEKTSHREALAAPGNQLLLYRDEPTYWDAWDVDPQHMESEAPCSPATSARLVAVSPLRAEVVFERPVGVASHAQQIVRLNAGSRRLEFHTRVDWHESHRMLKVAFPVNVRSMHATYEMQFGTVERPTHFNTSYDLARYEVPGHRFAVLSEYGFGVALLSESKYGWSTFGNTMRLSLLRSSKHPDPTADMGQHVFSYALMPFAGDWRHDAQVTREARLFNSPVLWMPPTAAASLPRESFVRVVNTPHVIVDTVKKAEDEDATIVRLYEAHGTRGTATLRFAERIGRVWLADGLERRLSELKLEAHGGVRVPFQPHKIITLLVE